MKFKEFIESIKRDKKKGLILLIGLGGVVTVLILGAVYEPVKEKQVNQLEGIVVPVDTTAINNMENNELNTQNSNDDFFALGEGDSAPIIADAPKEERKQTTKPIVYRNYSKQKKYNQEEYSYKQSNTTVEEKQEIKSTGKTPDKKRRRAPNDAMGNTVSNEGTKSMYNAVIANNNKIVKSGSYVSIRVGEDINVNGKTIGRNSIISGIASVNQERMSINITSVRIGNMVEQVNWIIYDQDGNEGIIIPETVLNEVTSNATDEAIDKGSNKVEANVPIVGNVKVSLKKKNKEVSFILNNGHKIYIKAKK